MNSAIAMLVAFVVVGLARERLGQRISALLIAVIIAVYVFNAFLTG